MKIFEYGFVKIGIIAKYDFKKVEIIFKFIAICIGRKKNCPFVLRIFFTIYYIIFNDTKLL